MADLALYLPQIRMDLATIETRVRTAEAEGWHSAWLMDHLAPPMAPDLDCFEAWTLATALAVRTEKIRIGHLVLCDAFRPPAVLAKMAVTLDHVSGGRLELGLGWGSVPDELHRFGITEADANTRSARLADTLAALDLLFSGDQVSFDGEHVRLVDAQQRPTPLQERIPIHLGGSGERLTMPLVKRFADWWNCPAYAPPTWPATLADLRQHRPELRVSRQIPIGLAPSSADVDAVRALTERRFGRWGPVVCGTPDEVAGELRAQAELGVDLFICQLHDFGEASSLELMAREVAPALA